MLKNLYSKRQKGQPDSLSYEIPELVRSRVFQAFNVLQNNGLVIVRDVLGEVYDQCLLEYGGLATVKRNIYHRSTPQSLAEDHFFACSVEYCLDFIEMCFQTRAYRAQQQGVELINRILREEGIGFEFSPYVLTKREIPNSGGGYQIVPTFPLAIKKSDTLVHATIIMPALAALVAPYFKSANDELLKAHAHFRLGEFVAAINSAGQAHESVFKIICAQKGWAVSPKATLKDLVECCKTKGLIDSFYVEPLKGPGMIRNHLGSHGSGTKTVIIKPEQAEHMIHLVSSNILLLIRLAGI